MKQRNLVKPLAVVLLLAAALLFPIGLAAHGVEVSLVTGETEFGGETVRFMYSTGEEMSFAVIRIFAPSRPGVETLQSLTDRNGYFSFIPDEAGEWLVSAEDDMGHRGEIRINVGASGNAGAAASGRTGKAPLVLRLILGLSLILNIFTVYRFILGRRALAAGKGARPRGAAGKGGEHAYQ
jgi:nickel transport protein